MRTRVGAVLIALAAAAGATAAQPLFSGHVKVIGLAQRSDGESLESELGLESRYDLGLDARVSWKKSLGSWTFEADYLLLGLTGDEAEARRRLGEAVPQLARPTAESWFDLEHTIHQGGRSDYRHGLDRLTVGYAGAHLVARVGRQALSWGNGLAFRPFDLFNPFSFNALDTEYKLGTDMVYGQWLFDRGSDLQTVVVPRRDRVSGDVESGVSSAAVKWHRPGRVQTDALVAEDWGDGVLGLGLAGDVGGAVWRVDATGTFVDGGDEVLSIVANYDTARAWRGRSTQLFAELYYNGFGVSQTGPTFDGLPEDLTDRLLRGQIFVVNRLYALGGARVQWTPLLTVAPTLIVNLEDGSFFASLEAQRDLAEAYTLQARLEVPIGGAGTEFGGLPLTEDAPLFGASTRAFVRIARYF